MKLSRMRRSEAIVLRFSDGLGNQMFQYAFARMHSHASGLPLLYDLSWYRQGPGLGRPDRPFLMDQYAIAGREMTPEESTSLCPHDRWVHGRARSLQGLNGWWTGRRFIVESAADCLHHYTSFRPEWMRVVGGAFISGFFACHAYPAHVRSLLLQELQIKAPLPMDVCQHVDHLQQHESVAVCFRRGDYAQITDIGIMPVDYYRRAMAAVRERVPSARFYIFSDEPDEAYRQLGEMGAELVEWANADRPPPQKLAILQACRHYILANSTFGWWAAWLGQRPESVITRPSLWYLGLRRAYGGLFPPEWITMEV